MMTTTTITTVTIGPTTTTGTMTSGSTTISTIGTRTRRRKQHQQPENAADVYSYDDYYGNGKKGKGKGGKRPAGDQCTQCGSKWHSTENCPMNSSSAGDSGDANHSKKVSFADDDYSDDYYGEDHSDGYDDYYGNFRRKGRCKGKKGKSKGIPRFGKSWFPSFGFKGRKGKVKGKKGKGKRKGPWKGKGYGTHVTYADCPTTSENYSVVDEPSGFVATSTTDDEPGTRDSSRLRAFENLFGDVSPIRPTAPDVSAEANSAVGSLRTPLRISLSTSLLDDVAMAPVGDELPRQPSTSMLNHSANDSTNNPAEPMYVNHC